MQYCSPGDKSKVPDTLREGVWYLSYAGRLALVHAIVMP